MTHRCAPSPGRRARRPRRLSKKLAIANIQSAADIFRTTYNSLEGRDGFVSLEVSPTLAMDTEGTIAEARRPVGRGGSAEPDDQGAGHHGGRFPPSAS